MLCRDLALPSLDCRLINNIYVNEGSEKREGSLDFILNLEWSEGECADIILR